MGRLVVRQLLAGRDFAVGDDIATAMANFVYLVGDTERGECLVVDPAWDIDGILATARGIDLEITGALVTHYHPDHVGGEAFGESIQGLARLMEVAPCKVHVHEAEADGVKFVTGLSEGDLVRHGSGDKVTVGEVDVELRHTPGHTPGSQCFLVRETQTDPWGSLVAGDTLFLQGCGRVDLPGGDADEMFRTLSTRLSDLPGDTVLMPGHAYGGEQAPLSVVRKDNPTLQIKDLQAFRQRMGG